MQQLRSGVHTVDYNIDHSLIVVVAERTSASRCIFENSRAALACNLLEPSVAQVSIKVLVLGVFQIALRSIYLWIHVAIRHKNVEPAIVIHIEEAHSPTQQPGIYAQAAWIGSIFE